MVEFLHDENIINIHSKSFLEVADIKHRYGKNLRLYYNEFCKIHDLPTNIKSDQDKYANHAQFFKWLDDPSHRCSVSKFFYYFWVTLIPANSA